MADELDPVTQKFIADLTDYVEPIEEAAADTQEFADTVEETVAAIREMKDEADSTAEALAALSAAEGVAAASAAELDHERHAQAESYFALAAAMDAAGLSQDDLGTKIGSGNVEAQGLAATLQGLRDILGDAGLGESLRVTHTGLNQFQIDTEDAEKTAKAAAFSETAFRDAMLEADEASIQARADMDAYKASIDGLRMSVVGMYAGEDLAKLSAGLSSGGGEGAGGITQFLAGFANPGGLALFAAGALAVAPAIMAVIQEVGLLINGFIAAGAGIGAFALLALPTLDKIKNAYTNITSAQVAYHAALQLEEKDPTAANKTALADALAKLKIAEDNVSPSTRTAVSAINELKTSYENMAKAFAPDAMKVFNDGLKIANELLPTLQPLAEGAAGSIDGLLGKLKNFFQTSTPGGTEFSKGKLIQLPPVPTGFGEFLAAFDKISPSAITAIGQGIGDVASNFGKLITAFPKQDVANAINIFFRVISGSLTGIEWVALRVAHNWDEFSGAIVRGWQNIVQWAHTGYSAYDQAFNNVEHALNNVGHAFDNVEHAFDNFNHAIDVVRHDVAQWTSDVVTFVGRMASDVEGWFLRLDAEISADWTNGWDKVVSYARSIPGRIVSALASLGGLLERAGENAIDGLLHGLEGAAGGVISYVRGLASDIGGIFASVLRMASPSLVFWEHGSNIVQGLINGIQSRRGELLALVRDLGSGTSGALTGTASQSIIQHQVSVNVVNGLSTVAFQQALQQHVQAAVLTTASQNTGSLLTLPGRR